VETVTTISKVLKAERKRLGLTQGELAAKLDCTQQNLSEIERGDSHPSEKLLDRMLEVFGQDSPIAYVSRRGDVRVPGSKLESRLMEFVEDITVEPGTLRRATAKLFGADDKFDQQVLALLPPNLKGYWSPPNHKGVDYESPKLLVEAKGLTGHRLNDMARLGMQQLCVARAKRNTEVECLLLLVFKGVGATFASSFDPLWDEARLLRIGLVICNGAEGVASTITNAENPLKDEGVPAEDEEDY
jgi:transcriptional regulator with XRE-family HTH domain